MKPNGDGVRDSGFSGEFKRTLNVFDVFAIVAGAMISTGIFVLPSVVFRIAGPSIILAYFFAGIMILPALLSLAELVTAMPKSGGTYFFIERSFGPLVGTFVGLAIWFSIALKAAFALIGIGIFIKLVLPYSDPVLIKYVAIGFTLIFVLINLRGVKESGSLQLVLVVILVGILLFYIVTGIERVNVEYYSPFKPGGWRGIFTAAGMVFISFGGLTSVTNVAGEVRNPGKLIPLGMFAAFIVVMILYLLSIFVTVGVLEPEKIAVSLTPLSEGARFATGTVGLILLSIGASLSFITTANAGIMSSSRVPFAMSKDKLLPKLFGRVGKKRGVPFISVIFTGFFIGAVIMFLDLESLVKVASTMKLILFFFVSFSVILMRYSGIVAYRPMYKAPLFPWLQIIGMVVYITMIVEMGRIPLLITLGFLAISIVWYFTYSKRNYVRNSAIITIAERVMSKEIRTDGLSEELREILFERDNLIDDRFDKLIKEAVILDYDKAIVLEELFEQFADIFSSKFALTKEEIFKLLIERENESTTVIYPSLAIPHIVIDGKDKFEIIVARTKKGVIMPGKEMGDSMEPSGVKIIFALAGTRDERDFHLQALMAIAQIVQNRNFEEKWLSARGAEELRNLILISERKRKTS